MSCSFGNEMVPRHSLLEFLKSLPILLLKVGESLVMCIADLVSSVESLFPDRFKPNLYTTMYEQCLQQILKLLLSSKIEEL